jgi:hypothetical protein
MHRSDYCSLQKNCKKRLDKCKQIQGVSEIRVLILTGNRTRQKE